MSTFERYDEAAAFYDGTRVPVGLDIVREALARLPRPPAESVLLDAGCGTGAYTAALSGSLGRVVALDRSGGMLQTARRKLARQASDEAPVFLQGDLLSLPLAAASVDALLFNQVLHHLEPGDGTYAGHRAALAEAARVLRPGGLLLLNACTHEQLCRGFWFYGLIPRALERVLARCAPETEVAAILEDLGFALQARRVPRDAVLQGAAYFDPRGPLDPAWRRGDSIWALAEPEELAAAKAQVRQLEAEGGLTGFVAQADAARPEVGQVSFFVAVRR